MYYSFLGSCAERMRPVCAARPTSAVPYDRLIIDAKDSQSTVRSARGFQNLPVRFECQIDRLNIDASTLIIFTCMRTHARACRLHAHIYIFIYIYIYTYIYIYRERDIER